jgi:hypothetical protein
MDGQGLDDSRQHSADDKICCNATSPIAKKERKKGLADPEIRTGLFAFLCTGNAGDAKSYIDTSEPIAASQALFSVN